MLTKSTEHLNYFNLLSLSRKIDPSVCRKTVRMAVLADCAPQQIALLLKSLFFLQGVFLDLYEADYDTIELEAFNPSSGMYQFKPEVIFILNTPQALRHKYYSRNENNNFPNETLNRITGIWNSIRRNSDAAIIQSNFVLPMEQFFGNFDTRISESLTGSVRQINGGLISSLTDKKNIFLADLEALASWHGRQKYFDEKLWIFGKTPASLEMLPFIAQSVVDITQSSFGQGVKCVICDLDNTLWGGVIGDDGLEGIVLGHLGEGEAYLNLQHFLIELKKRGIVLAVCSKNDHANAILPFREHPEMILKENDIAVFVANWENKADNIKYIQKVLNIGFDSMVFLDDSPFERNLVRERLPDVTTPELPEDVADYVRYLTELNLFETTSFTGEDQNRAEMYRVQAMRSNLENTVESIDDYLISLEMKIHISRFDAFNLPRIAQLIQRSNQFNLTTSRYNEVQCKAFMDDEGYLPLYIKLKDKFGDYGLISVIVLRLDGRIIHIDEWLMSCRVLSRGVEEYAMNYIFTFAEENGFNEIKGYYKRSEKNSMVKDFYRKFRFLQLESSDDKSTDVWHLKVDEYAEHKTYLENENY